MRVIGQAALVLARLLAYTSQSSAATRPSFVSSRRTLKRERHDVVHDGERAPRNAVSRAVVDVRAAAQRNTVARCQTGATNTDEEMS